MYHAACKAEFQPFSRSYSQLTFFILLLRKRQVEWAYVQLTAGHLSLKELVGTENYQVAWYVLLSTINITTTTAATTYDI